MTSFESVGVVMYEENEEDLFSSQRLKELVGCDEISVTRKFQYSPSFPCCKFKTFVDANERPYVETSVIEECERRKKYLDEQCTKRSHPFPINIPESATMEEVD